MLYNTTLPLPVKAAGLTVRKPAHSAKYWTLVTKGMDFSTEDRLDPIIFNRVPWKAQGQPSLSWGITDSTFKDVMLKIEPAVVNGGCRLLRMGTYVLFLATAFIPRFATAQNALAGISGSVQDQSGLGVPDATVELRQQDTQWSRGTRTGWPAHFPLQVCQSELIP